MNTSDGSPPPKNRQSKRFGLRVKLKPGGSAGAPIENPHGLDFEGKPQGFREPNRFNGDFSAMRQTTYRGWVVSWSRLERKFYAWDSQRHIKETRIEASNQEQILLMVDAATPGYKAPAFSWMAA
jgi:hypothetical protein